MNKLIIREKKGYIGLSLLILIIFVQLFYTVKKFHLVFENVLIYFFNGVPYFNEGTSVFLEFPWYWFVIQVYVLYHILLHLDFNRNMFEQFLIREERKSFFRNQIKNVIILRLSYSMLILFWIIILCIVFDIPFFDSNIELDFLINKIPVEVNRSWITLVMVFIVILFTDILLSVILCVFYILMNGMAAFLLLIVYYIGAFFIPNSIFLANYLMAGRVVQQLNGIAPKVGLILEIVILMIVYKMGFTIFRSKDILQNE